MMRIWLLIALVPTLAFADDHKSYNDKANVTHDCAKHGTTVSVNASDSTYAFTGSCKKISLNGSGNKVAIASSKDVKVNGARNTVEIDATDKIAATGVGNTIRWKRGLSGARPKISSPGINNKISQAK